MRVVSNTSPILNLAAIGEVVLLEQLFSSVIVPFEVALEIDRLRLAEPRFQSVHLPAFTQSTILKNQHVAIALAGELDRGEAAAIALAVEHNADLLLMDELRGRMVAKRFGISTLGLLGLLILAKQRGLLPAIEPLIDRLEKQAGFWVGSALRQRVLREAGEQ